MNINKLDRHGARLGYRALRSLSRMLFYIYLRGRVFGLENVPTQGAAMLVVNHQSYLDPMVAGLAINRECHFIARDSLFYNPHFGRLITYCNSFPVRRGEADVQAVKELLRRLRDGKLVVIFPEGTRSRDGSISRINPNSLSVAVRARVPIVPTLIDGTFRAMGRGAILPRVYPVNVIYSEPISAEDVAARPVEQTAELVTRRMHESLVRSAELRKQRRRVC